MRPLHIPAPIKKCHQQVAGAADLCKLIETNYRQHFSGKPEVSVVIPAYNEQDSILGTLLSLCTNQTERAVEIIVVNNNSTDRTKELVLAAGICCIDEAEQSITAARNRGLYTARGMYILNADADTIYPSDWIEEMIQPLTQDPKISLTYGRFAFIPGTSTPRIIYFFYEYVTHFVAWLKGFREDEAVNVYGFNSAFRRKEGLQVGGFEHPPGSNEDGWLALKLRVNGFGKLHYVKNPRALVWTSDRRIQIDGGLIIASAKRLKRLFFKRKHPALMVN